MKRQLIIAAFLVISTSIALACWFDTGWTTFTQPNGVTFVARLYGDEYEYRFETRDGFSLEKNFVDGYYCYATGVASGRFVLSGLRVGIDQPIGVSKGLTARDPVRARPRPSMNIASPKAVAGLAKAAVTTITLKVLLVEFQDIRGRSQYARADFQAILSGSSYTVSPDGETAFGSMKQYYATMSNGQLAINATVLNNISGGDTPIWVRLPQNKNYYLNSSTYTFDTDAYNAGVAAGYDLSTNATTKLVYIYAGNFYRGGLVPHAPYVAADFYVMCEVWGGRGVDRYDHEGTVQEGYTFSHLGVHSHEFGHVLGFLDLYGYNHLDWTLMADGCDMGPNAKGECPAPLDPNYRYSMNWITVSTPPTPNSGVTLTYNETTPTVYMMQSGQDVYYVENRRYLGFGTYCPGYQAGTGGLLVWHVQGSSRLLK